MTPGFHNELSIMDYVRDPCPTPSASRGVLKTILERSPKHAWAEHPRLGARAGTHSAAADMGSAAHLLLLGGDERIAWIEAKDWRTKKAKEDRDAAHDAGQIPLLAHKRGPLEKMIKVARDALDSMGPGGTEQTMLWQRDGQWCRSRPDWISEDLTTVVDYKTCANADPVSWIKSTMFSQGYDLQHAWAGFGLDAIDKPQARTYLNLIQETEFPFACSVVGLDEQELATSQEMLAMAFKIWARHLESGDWPDYGRNIHWAVRPSWCAWEWEDRQALLGGNI